MMIRFHSLTQPLVRLPSVEPADHETVFEAFAKTMARAVVAERVRIEPRVVSLRPRSIL